ncbi:MAG: signal peptidase I [Deltaproteobacteria bacterium]|nr:signal peptidase I [Deltaproteobacteria bacterium]MBW2389581.1 signal peptidase I [Deltaproteobacteria bacterium]MBW2725330.1 signal peptidase I [Deltaproteobacteria bacterium]
MKSITKKLATKRSIAIAATRPSFGRRVFDELLPMIIVSIIVMAARSSLADHYIIPSGSMEHTLAPGDHVVVDKLSYGVRIPFTGIELAPGDVPRRGEVVIFDSPVDGERLIKRIVAEGGDHVSLIAGELRIDGRSMRDVSGDDIERYGDRVARLNLRHGGGRDIAPMVVPVGHLLVVGDARGNSRDGRYFGLIPVDLPYGKAKGVIYRRGEGLVWKTL